MASISSDPADNALSQDPHHADWIEGITKACGVEPVIRHVSPVIRGDRLIWLWVWVAGDRLENFSVRIEGQDTRLTLQVKGPSCWVTLDFMAWFPNPEEVEGAARLAGFEW